MNFKIQTSLSLIDYWQITGVIILKFCSAIVVALDLYLHILSNDTFVVTMNYNCFKYGIENHTKPNHAFYF